MKQINVSCCAECPFAIPEKIGDTWFCDAVGAVDGETSPRELPEQRDLPGGWPDPPEWCPLRADDRLVTLRSK